MRSVKTPAFGNAVVFSELDGFAFEPVGGGDDFHINAEVLGRSQAVFHGASPAAATADQTDTKLVGPGGVYPAASRRQGRQRCRSHCRGF